MVGTEHHMTTRNFPMFNIIDTLIVSMQAFGTFPRRRRFGWACFGCLDFECLTDTQIDLLCGCQGNTRAP